MIFCNKLTYDIWMTYDIWKSICAQSHQNIFLCTSAYFFTQVQVNFGEVLFWVCDNKWFSHILRSWRLRACRTMHSDISGHVCAVVLPLFWEKLAINNKLIVEMEGPKCYDHRIAHTEHFYFSLPSKTSEGQCYQCQYKGVATSLVDVIVGS